MAKIKRPSNYEIKRRTETKKLPKDGYVCKVLGVDVIDGNYGQQLKVSYDIAEGDYAGFFAADYKAQQTEDKNWHGVLYVSVPDDSMEEWQKRAFDDLIGSIEDSNDGYHWDWDTDSLRKKLFGALMRYREKEAKTTGNVFTVTEPFWYRNVAAIRSGEFTLPNDKVLQKKSKTAPDDFIDVPEDSEDELPFDI